MILQPIAFYIMSSTVIVNDEKLKPTITLYMMQYISDEFKVQLILGPTAS